MLVVVSIGIPSIAGQHEDSEEEYSEEMSMDLEIERFLNKATGAF